MNPLSILMALPQFLKGLFGTVDGITKAISNERIAVITATTEQDRIEAQERVNTLQMRRDVLIADASHSRIDMIMRVGFSLGPMSVLLKIFLWDKALGQWTSGHTDAMDPNLWRVVMIELGFYFLYTGATSVAKIMKSK